MVRPPIRESAHWGATDQRVTSCAPQSFISRSRDADPSSLVLSPLRNSEVDNDGESSGHSLALLGFSSAVDTRICLPLDRLIRLFGKDGSACQPSSPSQFPVTCLQVERVGPRGHEPDSLLLVYDAGGGGCFATTAGGRLALTVSPIGVQRSSAC